MHFTERFRKLGYVNTYEPSPRRVPRCPECGLRIRGPNHADGEQHKRRVAQRASLAKKSA